MSESEGENASTAGDRRPLASRDARAARWLADWLAARSVSPNAISLAGLVCGCCAGSALGLTSRCPGLERFLWLAAAGLIQLRLLANLMDGMVAQRSRRMSAVGELYNEIPDRVSDAATLIGLGYAIGGESALGFIAACLAMLTAYVRAMGKLAGAHQEYCGPMSKPQRMFLVTTVCLYMALAPGGWRPRWGAADQRGLAAIALIVIALGCVATVLRRLHRISAALRRPAA